MVLKYLSTLLALVLMGSVSAASLVTPDGGQYEGEVKNDRMHGEGRIDWPDGTYYVGEFKRGLKHGEGTETLLDGRVFQGEYRDGQWVRGVLHFPDGESYEGEFEKRRFHGEGQLTFRNRTVYEGRFEEGEMNGEGRMTTSDGTVYEGDFVQDRLPKGTITYSDGSVYEGELRGWQPHGEGRMTPVEGAVLAGEFEYGEFVGEDGQAAYERDWAEQQERLERALYTQRTLVDEQLKRLVEQTPDTAEVYTVLAALSNAETVFRTEVETIDAQLTDMPAFDGRLVTLANELQDDDNFPLATETSLRHFVRTLGKRLGEEDLIFLYLTSHGSPEHELSVDFNSNLTLPGIDPEELDRILSEAPQNKVVVISACYSGGFVPELSRDDTVIITAAAADRPSFGCSNEETMTYFGRAFFETAFTLDKPLDAVFADAKTAVTQRETNEGHDPSNPQIWAADPVLEAWDQWRSEATGTVN
ncbi:C13 family peptidase [Saccharospirillum salsuginis]|uniref:Peptidase C13 n=1 Tax=Saccharospirillum salsuginis TaxID=418750 RepID=A0A918JZI9_9GAMM|nr:C13 family peptidase [Saccharospirillum salsuginis]GGX39122.1 peptidase C13 [Saccharospirillum salsuginis]